MTSRPSSNEAPTPEQTSIDTTRRVIQGVLADIWQRNRHANAERLAVVESASSALAAGELTPELSLDAAREAHKLAGGVGSFGFHGASEAARILEQFWRATAEQRPAHLDPEAVAQLVAFLRADLQQDVPVGFDDQSERPCPGGHSRPRAMAPPVEPRSETVDIVLIEDDSTVCDVLASYLASFDFSVRTFADGAAALAALAGPEPLLQARVILLDYDLPGADGLAVLRHLREAGLLEHTRVIMLSLVAAHEAVARAINAGANGYIAKPFHVNSVLDRVYACLHEQAPLFVMGPRHLPL
ncbi:MAG: response regulator [Chloroflexota bacterium]|nr:response regulator [Chloroflexota bacterium]